MSSQKQKSKASLPKNKSTQVTAAGNIRPTAKIEELLPLYKIGGDAYFGYRMVLAGKLFDRRMVQLLKECSNLALPQWRVLSQLGLLSDGTVRSLADGAAVDRAEVSRVLRELETQGLVQRKENTQDRRSPKFSITKDGRRVFDDVRKPISNFIENLVEEVEPADLQAASRVLWTFIQATLGELDNNTE